MIMIKPKFWDKENSFISILLYPISLIIIFFIFIKRKFSKIYSFKIPIICIGNIYVGGTGKTPTSILLANDIKKLGKKTAILRKYYKTHQDEHNLIRKNFENLILSKKRINGLLEAERSKFDIIILDDGLQDYNIKKDLSIVCFNGNQLIGNGQVLPAGPLREKLSALKNIDIVIINGDKNESFEKKILHINNKLDIFYSSFEPINIDQFKDKKLFVLAGIGNPENFFQLIEKNNLNIKKKIVFPDHYNFKKDEIDKIIDDAEREDCQIIMTEKDYFKFKGYKADRINFLSVKLHINNKEKLLNRIKDLYDKDI